MRETTKAKTGETVLFGNGFLGMLYDVKRHPKNKKKVRCKIKPASSLCSAYNLKHGTWTKEYNMRDIVPLNRGKYGRTLLFLCGFNGEKTSLQERVRTTKLNLPTKSKIRKKKGTLASTLFKLWDGWFRKKMR